MSLLKGFFSRSAKKNCEPQPPPSGERYVKNVMIPRTDIIYALDTLDYTNLRALFLLHKFHALPVCHQTLDCVTGIINFYTGSMLNKQQQQNWQDHTQKPLFIPASMRCVEAAHILENAHTPFLLVIDEYGGVDGLVSKTHLLRSFTTDNIDASNETADELDGIHHLNGRMPLDEFTKKFTHLTNIIKPFKERDIETVGGLVCHLAEHFPKEGEQIVDENSGLRFRITKANNRKIESVAFICPPLP